MVEEGGDAGMRVGMGMVNPWNRIDQYRRMMNNVPPNRRSATAYSLQNRNQIQLQNRNQMVMRVRHQEEAGQAQETNQTYNREGQRVPYTPPGEVFEAQA